MEKIIYTRDWIEKEIQLALFVDRRKKIWGVVSGDTKLEADDVESIMSFFAMHLFAYKLGLEGDTVVWTQQEDGTTVNTVVNYLHRVLNNLPKGGDSL